MIIGARREYDRLRSINALTTEALEQEMRRAQREAMCWKRYQGALRGNINELKLRRTERDEALKENATLMGRLRSY